jgi:ubiquinone/menaquinone biosynthesis C-methylase UbiE
MRQGLFETMLEHNPLRAGVRELMEVRPLREATDVGPIPEALHIACGNGEATKLLAKYFAPARLTGIDRDPDLVALARERQGNGVFSFSRQEGHALDFPDDSFDAIFDLAELHNLRDWPAALAELHRALKPGGLLILEELSRETFARAAGRLFKVLTDHPYESMLTIGEFRERLLGLGFELLHFRERNPLGLLFYFTMVARKTA